MSPQRKPLFSISYIKTDFNESPSHNVFHKRLMPGTTSCLVSISYLVNRIRNAFSFTRASTLTHIHIHAPISLPSCVKEATKTLPNFFSAFFFFFKVRPDPPVSVNWTLLDISSSGLNYDVLVNWEPPPSADTKFGWMNIAYELQYRDRNTTNWETVSISCGFFSCPLGFPERSLHTFHLCTYIAFTTMMFPSRGKKCCSVQTEQHWARCHVSSLC